MTDPQSDADRRAWHRAQATSGPDDEVAAELVHSADRARARGGFAAAAALLERATMLTVDPGQRADRALAAASAKVDAGTYDAALRLLAMVEGGLLTEFQRARVDLIRAQLAYVIGRAGDAPALLLNAARRLEPINAALARATYLDALSGGLSAGRSSAGVVLDIARAAQASPRASTPGLIDHVLDALVTYVIDGYVAALPALRCAISATLRSTSSEEPLRCLYQTYLAALRIWDDESMAALSARHIELARGAGALNELVRGLTERIFTHVHVGELDAAESLIDELHTVTQQLQTESEAIGSNSFDWVTYARTPLAAFRGDQSALTRLTEAATQSAKTGRVGVGLTTIEWATATLYNSPGRYGDALAVARRAAEQPGFADVSQFGAAELVEAAARRGATEIATDALVRLTDTTSASGTDWALGIEARSRAAQPWCGGRPLISRGRRSARPQPHATRLCPGTFAVRRVAAP